MDKFFFFIIAYEATLKRVYYYLERQNIVLQAENPTYKSLIYEDDELENIRILSKAVCAHIYVY